MFKKVVSLTLCGMMLLSVTACSNSQVADSINSTVSDIVEQDTTETLIEKGSVEEEQTEKPTLNTEYTFEQDNTILVGCNSEVYQDSSNDYGFLVLRTKDNSGSYTFLTSDKPDYQMISEYNRDYETDTDDWISIEVNNITMQKLSTVYYDSNVEVYVWVANNNKTCIMISCVDNNSSDAFTTGSELLNNIYDISN
jgi:hypothetical protein